MAIMPKIHDIFFIGERFYIESSTMMSSIYEKINNLNKFERQYYRSDWNKVSSILEEGEIVYLRPATNDEMLWAYQELDRTKETWKKINKGEK